MGKNRFDSHIKQKFDSRKITPNTEVWSRIAIEVLHTSKQQVSISGYFSKNWTRYAAVLVVLLLASWPVYKGVINTTEVVVLAPTSAVDSVQVSPIKKQIEFESEVKLVERNLQKNTVTAPAAVHSSVKEISIMATLDTEEKADVIPVLLDDVIASNIAMVLEETNALLAANNEVTDAEIDSLLRSAEARVYLERKLNVSSKTDALTLLNEVEMELDASFREQLFNTLKSGFLKARTALADRNQ